MLFKQKFCETNISLTKYFISSDTDSHALVTVNFTEFLLNNALLEHTVWKNEKFTLIEKKNSSNQL